MLFLTGVVFWCITWSSSYQEREGFVPLKKFFIDLVFLILSLWKEGVSGTAEAIRASERDPLTGLLNWRGMEQQLLSHPNFTALAVIDLDHFKAVNDTHGHVVGNEVLVSVGRRLQRIRPSDVATRLGGEEFGVLLYGGDEVHAVERIYQLLCGDPYRTEMGQLAITVSCGVAQRFPGEGFNALFERADAALYRAKEGRNRVVVASKN